MQMDSDSSETVDLYLGGDLGLWVLQNIAVTPVRQVLTIDETIAHFAQEIGLKVWLGNANEFVFTTSKTGLSVHYPRILREKLIAQYQKIYNLHPGYLPWGRGFYPVFWALWEGTQAGATLHEITLGIDEGPIVDQIAVPYDDSDTGGSLWHRVRQAEQQLFQTYWPAISQGDYPPTMSQQSGGTFHLRQEFFELKQGTDWRRMDVHDLMKLIRCLSFPGHSGLEVFLGGKKFSVLLECLSEAESTDETTH